MDYQGNSDKSKEQKPKIEEKKLEKVISGDVVVRKKGIGRKFKEIFIGGNLKSVGHYVADEIILPGLRDLMWSIYSRGGERMIYGESNRDRRRYGGYGSQRTQYNNPTPLSGGRYYYGPDPRDRVMLPDQPPRIPPRRGSNQSIPEFVISSRSEAEHVLEVLLECIERYDVATVADLHELIGYPSTYVDNQWGWRYLKNVQIRQIPEGYLIDLPNPDPV